METPQAQWRLRLGSAFRTMLACTIVGCTTLYGPEPVRNFLTFPTFSYVTTILIVSDATLGDALRGCWHVVYASIQVMLPSMLSLWLFGPARFEHVGVAALAVGLTSFLIALPDSTHLMAKRIAFGQTVIVYVGAVVQGAESTGAMMHPVRVVSSTALGALASLLAMLLPYPHLAYREVRKTCRLYAENASKRLNLLMEAFCAQDSMTAIHLMTEAKLVSQTGAKLLRSIKDKREGMLWEKPRRSDPGEKMQEMEMPIQGMELALTSCTSFPIRLMNAEFQDVLKISNKQIALKLEQANCSSHFDAATAPEMKGAEYTDSSFWTQKAISTNHEDLSPFFFLYCMQRLQDGPEGSVKHSEEAKIQESNQPKTGFSLLSLSKQISIQGLVFAIKCSLSLGLAVLLGLIYNKQNGYYSGLIIATSFVRGRKATFTLANARAQGTAMGSVYGIVCCFMIQKLTNLRFLLLLPWILFTSFLRHSRMYGQAGSISAVIGALMILGRTNYGSPSEFAIARIAEATIGLICLVAVEILLHPVRSATLAKTELSRALEALQVCFEGIGHYTTQKEILGELSGKHNKLKSHVNQLENFIAEAELEPNFWFLPFHCGCYHKLLRSISKMTDLLGFLIHQIKIFSQASQKLGITWDEIQVDINSDLQHLIDKIGSLVKRLDELEQKLQMITVPHDLELGKSPNADDSTRSGPEQNNIAEIVRPSLQLMMRVADNSQYSEADKKLKSQMVLCLCTLLFCIHNLKREAIDTEKEIWELLKWESPPARHESCMNYYLGSMLYGKDKSSTFIHH